MFGLPTDIFLLLLFSLLAACAFEFVNGFHDTANAVATVIYTNSLKPNVAVILSGFCNFLGVLFGGIAVAMSIVNLLPVELLIDENVYHSIAMVMALLFSAIIWNVGTWYFGLPSSSSHTLIGSILGVGLAFSLMKANTRGDGVNWHKAGEVFLSLLVSPLFGFSLAIILMFILRRVLSKEMRKEVFDEPKKNMPPPTWIRGILITTCTLVSFFHGSNDGQKGVGLVMLILIGIVPGFFAVNTQLDPMLMSDNLTTIEHVIEKVNRTALSQGSRVRLDEVEKEVTALRTKLSSALPEHRFPENERMNARKSLLVISDDLKNIVEDPNSSLSEADKKIASAAINGDTGLRRFTDYSPRWVILMISISLGLGTMIGWKRIVVTIGEKIGKQHLTYAQGASAEIVAAATIAASSGLGLPVSTTHVLSSGIAGTMVANKGIKNLQAGTVRNILLAWLLTLPVSMILAGTFYVILRWIFT